MSTLAEIAAGYGLKPSELAALVGLHDLDPHAELTGQQAGQIVNAADNSDFFGDSSTGAGRHRFR